MFQVPAILLGILLSWPSPASAEEVLGKGPLRVAPLSQVAKMAPKGSHVLIDRPAIERFLAELEGTPPDWATVYGHGHHDPGHDDRLFELNRTRDAKRQGKQVLRWLLTFVWPGELSLVDGERGIYAVSVGPRFNPTNWGMVRFKPEDLPANLRALPTRRLHRRLLHQASRGGKIEISVVMSGHLIPDESIVYDFSHDEEGLGLIMPVVRVERIDYVLPP